MPETPPDLAFKWISAVVGGAGFLLSLVNFWRARAVTRIRLVRMHSEDSKRSPVMVMNVGNQPCVVCEIWARRGEYLTAHKVLAYSVAEDDEAKPIAPGSARTFDLPNLATHEEGEIVVYTAVLQNEKQVDGIQFFDSGAWEIALRLVCDAIVQRSRSRGNALPAKLFPVVHKTGFRLYAEALPRPGLDMFWKPPLLKVVKPMRSRFLAHASARTLGVYGCHIAAIGMPASFGRHHDVLKGWDRKAVEALGDLVPEAFEVFRRGDQCYLLWTPLMTRIAFGLEDLNSLRAVLKDVKPVRSAPPRPPNSARRQKVRR